MKRTLLILLTLCAAFSRAQTTDGHKSGLSSSELRRLRGAHQNWLLPTAVPAGYKVWKFELHVDKDPRLTTLAITYKKGRGEIMLQECSEGIGDIIFGDDADGAATSGTYTYYLPMMKGVKQPLDYQHVKGVPQWHADWVTLPGKKMPRVVSSIGERCEPRLGVDLMESLRFLR